jgi:hypothetical protein
MPKVTVIGAFEKLDPSYISLDRRMIDILLPGNKNLNEILQFQPGIQASDNFRSSDTGGEILPPPLSISGGKVYENNFLIDGFGNNSLLDPTFDSPSSISNVPGNPQEFFLDADLFDEVTVYRSNVPARYGGFTGGVVEARTRAPSEVVGLKAAYRTTRSEWTRFHVDEDQEKEFENSRNEKRQPHFRKHDASLSLDLPLTAKALLLANYSLLYSRIPLDHLGGTEVQTRTQESVFLKAVLKPMLATEWITDFLWAPYASEYFLRDTRDSQFTIEGGGYAFNTRLNSYLAFGYWELAGGYRESSNSRSAPRDQFYWRNSPSADWGLLVGDQRYSREGGNGDIEKKQDTLTLATHFTTEPLSTGALSHVVATGLQYERVSGLFERPETLTRFTNSTLNNQVVCAPADVSCLPGEQFMIFKTVYEADVVAASVNFTGAYLEDAISLGRFSLRPGLRLSHDDLQDNTDLAPRLAASLDLFGNGRTVLTTGLNRYYGKILLTHALEEEKKPLTAWSRPTTLDGISGMPQAWVKSQTSKAAIRLADLDTPYADEITAGLSQVFLGGELNLLYLDRRGRDELTVRVRDKDENGYTYSEWTNEGKTGHHEGSLTWERRWRRHLLLLNTTWEETETSHLDYAERFEGDAVEEPVWFEGSLLQQSELPASDFNREWTANLVYNVIFPRGFSFTNVTHYRSGYHALINSGDEMTLADGRVIDIYEEVKNPESWIFDWKVIWQSAASNWGKVLLSLEIYNVFNEKVQSGADSTRYEIGRQFWAGVDLTF